MRNKGGIGEEEKEERGEEARDDMEEKEERDKGVTGSQRNKGEWEDK